MTDDRLLVSDPPGASATLILLHGLGASGDDLFPLAKMFLNNTLRVVCPDAPVRPVTINGGCDMRAWYDIHSAELTRDYDEDGINASADAINALIDAEIARGFAPDRIVLGGFSQGAAMALHVGLRRPAPLAGVIALSGYLLFPDRLPTTAALQQEPAPVFLGHGRLDPVVWLAWGQQARERLVDGGYTVEYREYTMAHAILPEEIEDINNWLSQRLEEQQ